MLAGNLIGCIKQIRIHEYKQWIYFITAGKIREPNKGEQLNIKCHISKKQLEAYKQLRALVYEWHMPIKKTAFRIIYLVCKLKPRQYAIPFLKICFRLYRKVVFP